MTENQEIPLNIIEQVKLNKESIYTGIDFKLSVLSSVLSLVLLINLLIYELFSIDLLAAVLLTADLPTMDLISVDLSTIDFSSIDLFIVSTLTPIISSLFSTFIGVLATIVAFSFAGLIFFISFHADDKSISPLRRESLFPQYLFIFQWLAFIGVCGIISCSITIACVGLNNGIVLSLLFVVSIFFISYTLFSVLSAFSTMSKFGQIRFQKYACKDDTNNAENQASQNTSESVPCSQPESNSPNQDSAN